jgi:hypothetical protein
MPQPTNKLAPEVTGVNRLLDFIVQRLPADKFSTNARTLIETAQGNRDPITESHFSPDELAAIKELITLKGGDSGSIQYGDYHLLSKAMHARGQIPMSTSPSLMSMGDPLGNIQTTLGRFRYARDPKGNLIVQDTYDFNPPQEGAMQEQRTGDYGALGPYGLIRDYAGEKIPPGYGRPVNINLGR